MILLETAMKEEGFAIPDLLSLKKSIKNDFIFYNEHICYIRHGWGKVNTAIFTQMCIEKFPIDCIINFGMVGAMSSNMKWGDIVFPTKVFQHDFDCRGLGFDIGVVPDQDRSLFVSDKRILDDAKQIFPNIKVCEYLLTGDSFITEVISGYEDSICDMEGYSVARVADVNNIPFAFFKLVSDCCNNHSDTNFQEALDKLSLPFQEKIAKLIIKLSYDKFKV